MKTQTKRSRSWAFTLNNYTDEELEACKAWECKHLVFGKEVSSTGTPHLQGNVVFSTLKSLAQLKKLNGRAHWTQTIALEASIEYCEKDGDVFEKGLRPATNEEKGLRGKAAMKEIIKRARKGDEEWLEEHYPAEYYHHLATFRSHKKPKVEVMNYEKTPHEWWVGETGTGKSKLLWELYPNHFRKDQNKWWCGYRGQEVVAIEEASPKTMEHLASRLKQWADRYPFDGEIKGGKIEGIRPAKVIVLSNYTIEQCFPNPEDSEPMKRRFKVTHFKTLHKP